MNKMSKVSVCRLAAMLLLKIWSGLKVCDSVPALLEVYDAVPRGAVAPLPTATHRRGGSLSRSHMRRPAAGLGQGFHRVGVEARRAVLRPPQNRVAPETPQVLLFRTCPLEPVVFRNSAAPKMQERH